MLTVLARGRAGIVILRDSRPDGTYVLLECHEFEPTGGGGVMVTPDPEEFPMVAARRRESDVAQLAQAESFSLEVDVSEMPRGQLRFSNREFIEQALAEAEESRRKTQITPENAAQWGYLENPTPA
jgi:hypothetical protein